MELWLTVAQQKSFNVIPHTFEKRCNSDKQKRNQHRMTCSKVDMKEDI